jgi:hypothetical protein
VILNPNFEPWHVALIGWDLDSTVFNTLHRQHMIPLIKKKKLTWEDYSLACVDDTVLPGRIEMMEAFHVGNFFNVGISGRNDVAREQTWQVIHKFGVPLDAVSLREHGDFRPNGEYKVSKILEWQKFLSMKVFFEDWREAGEVITAGTGVPVVVLDACYPEESKKVYQDNPVQSV